MITLFWRLLQRIMPPPPPRVGEVFTPFTESNRQICLELLNELKPLLNNRYDPLAANAVFIVAATSNISKFVTALKLLTMRVKAGRAIEPDDCNWVLNTITLDQFFITEDGFYIESSSILELVDVAENLCTLLEGGEEAEYGELEHNYRVLSKTLLSLKSILAALLTVLADS